MANPFVDPCIHLKKWAHLKPNQYCSLGIAFLRSYYWRNSAGEYHRVDAQGHQDGPALIHRDGTQFWYINGKFHCLDGPALIFSDGGTEYHLEGVRLTQQEWSKDIRVIIHHSQTQEGAEEWMKRL